MLPAFVDLHCHWRTPGFEYKEDIATGSRRRSRRRLHLRQPDAQHKAGLLFCGTGDAWWSSRPPKLGLCDVNQTVSITENFDGVSIDHLKTLPAGVKFITEDGHGVQDNATMAKAFAICTQKDITVMSHAEDMEISPVGLPSGRGHRDGAQLLAERILPDQAAPVPRVHPRCAWMPCRWQSCGGHPSPAR